MKKLFLLILLFTSVTVMAQSRGRAKQNRNYNNNAQKRYNGANYEGIIYKNTILTVGNHYQSANRQYYFAFQADGNLAIYRSADNRVLWSSGTTGRSVNRAEFQGDGNLVLTASNGTVVWDAFSHQSQQTKTVMENLSDNRTRQGRNALIMQNDGNLVIYSGRERTVKWASHSNQ